MKMLFKHRTNIIYVQCLMGLLLIIAGYANGQATRGKSYMLQEKIAKANEYYSMADYNRAIGLYMNVIEKFSRDTSIITKIANCYRLLNDTKSAEEWYRKLLSISGNKLNAPGKLAFAQLLSANGKYDEALQWYKSYGATAPSSDLRATEAIKSIENISSLFYDTMFYEVKPVNVNTAYDEFGACFYNDGIIFLSDRNEPETGLFGCFFSALNVDGNFSEPVKFSIGDKTTYNQGPVTFYNHFKNMIFSQNAWFEVERKKKVNVVPLQLFQANQGVNNQWEGIELLSLGNNNFSYTQPSITSDGKTLYFVSDRPGGFGGKDLYVSRMVESKWSTPTNLGNKINTPGDEMFPYIYKDTILYFSSNGHGGLGGLDIFKIGLHTDDVAETIGYPLNSSGDDFGIILDQGGLSGYFSSNRANGQGADDIYRFKLLRKTSYVKVIDDKTMLPISRAEIFNADTVSEKRLGITDQDGSCALVIPLSGSFQVRIKKEEYKLKKYTFESVNSSQDRLAVIPLSMEIKLAEMAQGQDNESIKNTLEAVSSIQGNIAVISTQPEQGSDENIKKTEHKSLVIPYKLNVKPKEEKVIITDAENKPIANAKNVIYKVQIWASRTPADEAELKLKYRGDLAICSFYDDRWYKYSIGEFTTYTEAKQCLYSSKVYDAFIIAYMNQKRVNIIIAKSATNESDVERPVRYLMMKP